MPPSPEKNKQWMTAQNGLANLEPVEVEMPEPGEGEVLVEINAVSLNYRDTEGKFDFADTTAVTSLLTTCNSNHGVIRSPRNNRPI